MAVVMPTQTTMSSTLVSFLLQLSLASSSSNNNDSIFDPQPQPYIVGGTTASHTRYPYLVSLGTDRTATDHSCAATLIAPGVLLSAAHCQGSFRFATLGMSDRFNSDTEQQSGQRITIRTDKTVVHPAYRWTAANPDIDFDFMLIKLTSPVDTSQFPPIRLNRNPRVPRYDAQPLTIVGWGATDVYGQRLSPTLQQATVGYVSPQTCDQSDGYIQGAYYSYRGFLTNSMMCAWSESADACLGDSGGPLIASGEDGAGNQDVQVGIVSFGVGCNSPDFPGLYSRISDQIGWIDEVVCELSDDPPQEFECVRTEEEEIETDSPTQRPTESPTARPTLRPSAAPVVAGKQQSVLEFLLGNDSEEGSEGEDLSHDEDPAGSMPMASPTVFEEPVTEPTDPPFAADLVWFDEEDDTVDISSANSVESQIQGNSESNDSLVLIIAASVGGVAFVTLLAVVAVLMSKRRNEHNADDENQRPASLCVRVLQQQDAEGQTMDHRGRQRIVGLGTAMEEEPSVEIVADAYR